MDKIFHFNDGRSLYLDEKGKNLAIAKRVEFKFSLANSNLEMKIFDRGKLSFAFVYEL